jgi:hypothetical protein
MRNVVPAAGGSAEDATTAVTNWLDRFNDPNAVEAGLAQDAVIVDEFAPYLWSGHNAPQRYLTDLGKLGAATESSGVRFDHAAPIRAESNGNSAYIVLPTILRLEVGGKALSAAGQSTFVMTRSGGAWKIASWTYSAPQPK